MGIYLHVVAYCKHLDFSDAEITHTMSFLSDNAQDSLFMHFMNEQTLDATDADSSRDLQSAFAAALNIELDQLGFEKGPGRTAALAKLLGMTRTQPYRILKGMSSPTTDSMADLREIGVSFDRILDAVTRRTSKTHSVLVNGEMMQVIVRGVAPGANVAAAFLATAGTYKLVSVEPGEPLSDNAIPIQSLEFVSRNPLAIVEDDASTRAMLQTEMSDSFRAVTFNDANSLLTFAQGMSKFKAFLIDWQLPDMDGEELVRRIRAASKAPIFILTGDAGASDSMGRAMDFDNVHHALKPTASLILVKRINTAIRAMS